MERIHFEDLHALIKPIRQQRGLRHSDYRYADLISKEERVINLQPIIN
jgi:hypothetical protein